jgi:hypothetical protein
MSTAGRAESVSHHAFDDRFFPTRGRISCGRYNEILKGEANAAQCFGSAEPHKESDRQYEIYCRFKETPDGRENAPIRFVFELAKTGWRLSASTTLMNDAERRTMTPSFIFLNSLKQLAVWIRI